MTEEIVLIISLPASPYSLFYKEGESFVILYSSSCGKRRCHGVTEEIVLNNLPPLRSSLLGFKRDSFLFFAHITAQ